jgi:hypothetical protein
VRETEPVSQTSVLYETAVGKFPWFLRTVMECDNPPEKLAKSKKIVNVIDLFRKVGEAQEKVQEVEHEVEMLSREQARKLELVKSGGSGSQIDSWRQELAANEKVIKARERETIPELQKAAKNAEEALSEALKNLSVSWSDGEGGPHN